MFTNSKVLFSLNSLKLISFFKEYKILYFNYPIFKMHSILSLHRISISPRGCITFSHSKSNNNDDNEGDNTRSDSKDQGQFFGQIYFTINWQCTNICYAIIICSTIDSLYNGFKLVQGAGILIVGIFTQIGCISIVINFYIRIIVVIIKFKNQIRSKMRIDARILS